MSDVFEALTKGTENRSIDCLPECLDERFFILEIGRLRIGYFKLLSDSHSLITVCACYLEELTRSNRWRGHLSV